MTGSGDVRDVRNARESAVTKFCLAMEEHRRTEAGRVRTAREMVDFFFPRAGNGAVIEDRIFHHIPREIRGPIVSEWGIRGKKSAIRDDDARIRDVVQDGLAAGDIDEAMFEDGVNAQILIDWIPLGAWWTFWRTGKLTGVAIQRALATARELALFDDRWFLLNVDGRGGKLKGTDTVCDTLTKDQIVAWLRRVHESGDGSPVGLVGALGWETILSKTSQEALLFALDAFARKVGLVASAEDDDAPDAATEMPARDNVAMPDIPALEPPNVNSNPPWGSGADASISPALESARSAVTNPPEQTVSSSNWPDVSSRNAPPPSEPPPSLQLVDDVARGPVPAIDKKGAPPPIPPRRR
jgi:hypothetical protein